jgi:hypothetical protein
MSRKFCFSTVCDLFAYKCNLSKSEDFWLRQNRDLVFDWLIRLTYWLGVRHTLSVVAQEGKIEAQILKLRPNYDNYSFYWSGLTVYIDDKASILMPSEFDIMEYRMQFEAHLDCGFDFRVYLASQIDSAIKIFFPGIQQCNKVVYCSSAHHFGASPVGCRQIKGQWLCPECERKKS